jgi:predicted RNA binding protein YcfA (HicA-like mRNA interferase family)
VLERHGWQLRRINGSHHIYAHPHDDRIVVVPATATAISNAACLASF